MKPQVRYIYNDEGFIRAKEWVLDGMRENGTHHAYEEHEKGHVKKKIWYSEGHILRVQEATTGDEAWYDKEERLHREDGPAYVFFHRLTGEIYSERWFFHGELHRVDGPADICHNKAEGFERWYLHGKPHRLDGPADISRSNDFLYENWWFHGKRHRLDGPATVVSRRNGNLAAYKFSIDGEEIPWLQKIYTVQRQGSGKVLARISADKFRDFIKEAGPKELKAAKKFFADDPKWLKLIKGVLAGRTILGE